MTDVQQRLEQFANQGVELRNQLRTAANESTLSSDHSLSEIKTLIVQLQDLTAQASLAAINRANSVNELKASVEALQVQTKLLKSINTPTDEIFDSIYAWQCWLRRILDVLSVSDEIKKSVNYDNEEDKKIEASRYLNARLGDTMRCTPPHC